MDLLGALREHAAAAAKGIPAALSSKLQKGGMVQ